jgi:hypothetical protein
LQRFAEYSLVGQVTFTPESLDTVIGDFSIGEDHDTIWVKVTQIGGNGPWPFSYGILGWQTAQGFELGSIKCYGEETGEVFRLGVGRPPLLRAGRLIFDPRSFNLAWVRAGTPWTLRFDAASGQSGSGSSDGDSGPRTGATLGVFADLADTRISYAFIRRTPL